MELPLDFFLGEQRCTRIGDIWDEESLQLSLFEDRTKERALAKAMDAIRDKFGPNALLRAVSYTPGSVARIRNGYIGGHQS